MAMAVRCGWPEVVEWLHFNVPESAQTMSIHCVNDAALWGHVDTLRVCSKYDLGVMNETTVVSAASGGQLKALEYVLSICEVSSTVLEHAMDSAISNGHVQVVQWLYKTREQPLDSKRLALALTSKAAAKKEMVRFIWSSIVGSSCSDDDALVFAVVQFETLCGTGKEDQIANLLTILRLQARDKDATAVVLTNGLCAALEKDRFDIARQLLLRPCLSVGDATGLGRALLLAIKKRNLVLIRLLVKCGRLLPCDLDTAFRIAAQPDYLAPIVQILFDFGVDTHCVDALPLLAKGESSITVRRRRSELDKRRTHRSRRRRGNGLWDYDDDGVKTRGAWLEPRTVRLNALQRVFAGRSQETAIAALCVASNLDIVAFLLQNEDKFYTERILLKNAPPCLGPYLVWYLLHNGRASDPDQVTLFDRVIEMDRETLWLTVREVEALLVAHDPEINALVVANRSVLVNKSLWLEAANAGNAKVIQYLCSHIPQAVQEQEEAMEIACTRGDLALVELLFAKGRRTVTYSTIENMMKTGHRAVVQFLIDQKDPDIQQVIHCVLNCALWSCAMPAVQNHIDKNTKDTEKAKDEEVGRAKLQLSGVGTGVTTTETTETTQMTQMTQTTQTHQWAVVLLGMAIEKHPTLSGRRY